jgi:hypothetical protein
MIVGIKSPFQYGWQHPGDTIGAAVWIVLALSVAVMIRRETRS